MKVILHALENEAYLDDKPRVEAISQSLLKQLKVNENVDSVSLVKVRELQPFVDSISSEDKDELHVVLCSGEHGLQKAKAIKEQQSDVLVVWTGHQYFQELNNLNTLPDMMQFPHGVLTAEQREALSAKTTLLEGLGLPHTLTKASLKDVDLGDEAFTERFKQASHIIGISLAGDAEGPDGKVKFFTPQDAKEQAKSIFQQVKKMKALDGKTLFVITNGPRTGSHDYTNNPPMPLGEDESFHVLREGEMPAWDLVTGAFKAELDRLVQAEELDSIDCIDVFPYLNVMVSPGCTMTYSGYKPLLKIFTMRQDEEAESESNDYYFVPSEAMSMVTESSYLTQQGVKVIAYRPTSESDVHAKHLEATYQQGGIAVLDASGSLRDIKAINGGYLPLSAEQVVEQAEQSIVDKIRSMTMSGKMKAIKGPTQENASPWLARAQAYGEGAIQYGQDTFRAATDYCNSETGAKVVKGLGVAALVGAGLFVAARSGALEKIIPTSAPTPSK